MIKEHEIIIKKFKGKKNTDQILQEKAKAISPLIINWALSFSIDSSLLEWVDEENKKKQSQGATLKVILECIFFNLHLVDRLAFKSLELKQRGTFMDSLYEDIQESTYKIFKEFGIEPSSDEFKAMFMDTYSGKMMEYSQYNRMFSEEGESPSGSLFWEFGKRVGELLGVQGVITPLATTISSTYFVDSCYPIIFSEK